MYDVKNKPDLFSHTKDESFKLGDIVYGLAEPRLDFFRSNKVIFARELGATIDSFAATKTEHKLMSKIGREKFPPNQDSYEQSLLSHPKYKDIHDKMGFLFGGTTPADDPEWVSRKCKAGLYWASKNNITIHFVLDDIDMNRVVLKSDKSFTASELRWIFRNRDDDKVKNVIKFWKEGKIVPAPWETSNGIELWKNYKPKNASPLLP